MIPVPPPPPSYTLTPGMAFAAAMVLVLGYIIARRHLSRGTSLLIALIKAAIPVVYFVGYYDRRWHFLDDFIYEQQGMTMLQEGFNPWTALATQEGRGLLIYLSHGYHVLYGWWNLLGQWMFGQTYWAPIFLNVLATFAAGYATARMLEELRFSPRYVRGFLVLFLLHLEVLVWSSFINLKDILIFTFGAFALRSMVLIAGRWRERRTQRTRRRRSLIPQLLALTIICVVSYYIRFYVPFILLASAAVWGVLAMPLRWRVAVVVAVPLAALWITRNYAWHLSFVDLAGVPFGLLRFALTPRPWGTESNYTFLILPAVVHWVLFVPAVLSGIALWFQRPVTRLPLIYLLVVMVLFAAVPQVQGPRHRVQALPLIVWLQFHALWWTATVRGPRARTIRTPIRAPLPAVRRA